MEDITELFGDKDRHDGVGREISGSELNSMLLDLFRKMTRKIRPRDLLKQFDSSRFCRPSLVDPLAFKTLEIEWLQAARERGYELVTLSPLTPLGTCSVVAPVDQNNIVSANRGMEVVSDATNVLALMIAAQHKKGIGKKSVKLAATHRHVRAQYFQNPAFTAHFGVFCMVTGGFDGGSFSFELENVFDHLSLHATILSRYFGKEKLVVRLYTKERSIYLDRELQPRIELLRKDYTVDVLTPDHGDYYQTLRFKIFVRHNDNEINLSDGGLVDWWQKLLSNRKHRTIISGSGLELLYKIRKGEI